MGVCGIMFKARLKIQVALHVYSYKRSQGREFLSGGGGMINDNFRICGGVIHNTWYWSKINHF